MNTTTLNLGLMVKILDDLRNQHVLECKFEQRMRQVQTNNNWNTSGIISPYASLLDHSHFAVPEQGAILSGGSNEYINLKQTMRSIWKTVNITGELERIQSQQFTAVKEEYGLNTPDLGMLQSLAKGRAIETIFRNAMATYCRIKNYYALQGTDASPIGVVTGAPAGLVVPFAWSGAGAGDIGNRMFQKNMQIQFYDTSAAALRNQSADYAAPRTASSQYSVVSAIVDRRASVNVSNSGAVTFDVLPTVALAAGDTAYVRQGYGAMPQGFLHWVSDTGNLLGESGAVARSTNPEVFCSTIQNNSASTDNTPSLMLEMESYLRGRIAANEPINLEIWMNKAQAFKYAKFGLNSQSSSFNVQRFQDVKALPNIDVGVPMSGNSFNNIKIEVDVDVPPSKNLWIDWLGWMTDVQTPDTIYEFHQNQQMYQSQNVYGEPIDAKQVTFFSQYNYRCTRFKTQGYQDDLSFDAAHIAQN
jgi:hypothetical protein